MSECGFWRGEIVVPDGMEQIPNKHVNRYLRKRGVRTKKIAGRFRVVFFAPVWAVRLHRAFNGSGNNLNYALRRAAHDGEFRDALRAVLDLDINVARDFVRTQRKLKTS
jgi:hypothetical protein